MASIAASNNTRYPAGEDQELVNLMNCIRGRLGNVDLGSIATIDSVEMCNYTRANGQCGVTCNHSPNSCHYGGSNGSNGAKAVDYGNEKMYGDAIIQAAYACGAKPGGARCENSAGRTLPCSDPAANHVHVTSASCDKL